MRGSSPFKFCYRQSFQPKRYGQKCPAFDCPRGQVGIYGDRVKDCLLKKYKLFEFFEDSLILRPACDAMTILFFKARMVTSLHNKAFND